MFSHPFPYIALINFFTNWPNVFLVAFINFAINTQKSNVFTAFLH